MNMTTSDLKTTPLHGEHIALGAKMVPFAGWHMPVEYSGVRQEHMGVRERAGLFDVSHMGEIRIQGPKALETVEWFTSNFAGKLASSQAQYSLLPNETGGLVDDIIVYCLNPGTEYLICVNASNIEKDYEWMCAHNRGAQITNESALWGQIAVQGPLAMQLAARVYGRAVGTIPRFGFRLEGNGVIVARTGYTGEDGIEIFVPAPQAVNLWRSLLNAGKGMGVVPVGLGARDTLRTEMNYPLYGHEIDDNTNPYSAKLGWVVKPDKKNFVGKDSIVKAKESGLEHTLVGFVMRERGVARPGYRLFSFDDREIGRITSGTPSPSLNENIGIAYVKSDWARDNKAFNVEIRGRMVQAEVMPTPFVKPRSRFEVAEVMVDS